MQIGYSTHWGAKLLEYSEKPEKIVLTKKVCNSLIHANIVFVTLSRSE